MHGGSEFQGNNIGKHLANNTAWKVSKYGVSSGPITGKYCPEKTPYLDTFHAVQVLTVFYFILVIAEKFIKIFRDKFYITGHHNPLKKGESKT